MWQDYAYTALMINVIATTTLVLRDKEKPSLRHCITAALNNAASATIGYTLGLRLSVLSASALSAVWLIVASQQSRRNGQLELPDTR